MLRGILETIGRAIKIANQEQQLYGIYRSPLDLLEFQVFGRYWPYHGCRWDLPKSQYNLTNKGG